MYKDVVAPALVKHRGVKRSYVTLEDNDPTGYKSNAAKDAKKELKICPIDFPTYSPDLNPLDFSLWKEVSDRMEKKIVKNENTSEYKARLRRTALKKCWAVSGQGPRASTTTTVVTFLEIER